LEFNVTFQHKYGYIRDEPEERQNCCNIRQIEVHKSITPDTVLQPLYWTTCIGQHPR